MLKHTLIKKVWLYTAAMIKSKLQTWPPAAHLGLEVRRRAALSNGLLRVAVGTHLFQNFPNSNSTEVWELYRKYVILP